RPGRPPSSLYTLSLHDALPIFERVDMPLPRGKDSFSQVPVTRQVAKLRAQGVDAGAGRSGDCDGKRLTLKKARGIPAHVDLVARSEEHTSELQSRENLVCRLLL